MHAGLSPSRESSTALPGGVPDGKQRANAISMRFLLCRRGAGSSFSAYPRSVTTLASPSIDLPFRNTLLRAFRSFTLQKMDIPWTYDARKAAHDKAAYLPSPHPYREYKITYDGNYNYSALIRLIDKVSTHILHSPDGLEYYRHSLDSMTSQSPAARRAYLALTGQSQNNSNFPGNIAARKYFETNFPDIVITDLPVREPGTTDWGRVYKGEKNKKNELFLNRELVDPFLAVDSESEAIMLEALIIVTLFHELAHCLTKAVFDGILTPVIESHLSEQRGRLGEAGYGVELGLFGCILRADFPTWGPSRVKRIQHIVIAKGWTTSENHYIVSVAGVKKFVESIELTARYPLTFWDVNLSPVVPRGFRRGRGSKGEESEGEEALEVLENLGEL